MATNNFAGLFPNYYLLANVLDQAPFNLEGILLERPAEADEMEVFMPIVMGTSQVREKMIQGRRARTYRKPGRMIEKVTIDANITSVAPGVAQTFKWTQNSTTAGPGFETFVQVNDTYFCSYTGTYCIVENVVVNGLNDVDLTVRGTSPTTPFIPVGLVPAGTPLWWTGNNVPEVSNSQEPYRFTWTFDSFGLTESRDTEYITGRDASGVFVFSPGVGGSDEMGLWVNSQLDNMFYRMRQAFKRKVFIQNGDGAVLNSVNPGYETLQSYGLWDIIEGRHPSVPAGFLVPNGGSLTLGFYDRVVENIDMSDVNVTEYVLLGDRKFMTGHSDMARQAGGTFDAWSMVGTGSGDRKGVNMDFVSVKRSGVSFNAKTLPVLNNDSGLKTPGGRFDFYAMGVPRVQFNDLLTGRPVPAFEIIHSGNPQAGYDRRLNVWCHGNPHVAKVLHSREGRQVSGPDLWGSSGLDSANVEAQTEWGLVARGTHMFFQSYRT